MRYVDCTTDAERIAWLWRQLEGAAAAAAHLSERARNSPDRLIVARAVEQRPAAEDAGSAFARAVEQLAPAVPAIATGTLATSERERARDWHRGRPPGTTVCVHRWAPRDGDALTFDRCELCGLTLDRPGA